VFVHKIIIIIIIIIIIVIIISIYLYTIKTNYSRADVVVSKRKKTLKYISITITIKLTIN